MKPDNFTISETMLDVGDGHQLYVQEWGSKDPQAMPIVFLHGGPGSGLTERFKSLFNPAGQRVVFFDQRGCGKSLPRGKLAANTTDKLVDDIKKVADNFRLDKFTIVGGSWGSCLALLFALKYPERLERMVIRGIFTGRQSEVDFLDKGGIRAVFPEVWEEFVSNVPTKYREEPMEYLTPRIMGTSPTVRKKAALAFARLDAAVSSLDDRVEEIDPASFDPTRIVIHTQYMRNKLFLPEGYILANASQIKTPTVIVQGRYDQMCPPFTAYELSQKMPSAQLVWTISGHSGFDRGNYEAVRAALGA